MTELKTKLLMCAIRTVGAVAAVWILGGLIRYFEINYSDVKTVLGFVNAYLPEALLLMGIGGGATVFYRMDQDPESDFSFDKLFKAGNEYDIYRFGYFWLLIVAGWVVFLSAWRDKPLEGILALVFGVFVGKTAVDSIAAAMGKPREKDTA